MWFSSTYVISLWRSEYGHLECCCCFSLPAVKWIQHSVGNKRSSITVLWKNVKSYHCAMFQPGILVTWSSKSSLSKLFWIFPHKSSFYHNIDLEFEYVQGQSIFLITFNIYLMWHKYGIEGNNYSYPQGNFWRYFMFIIELKYYNKKLI